MIFFITYILGVVCAAKLPPGVKLCHRSDPNFQNCVAKNIGDSLKYFANGYKELGIPALEPLFIDRLEIEGDQSQSVSLQQSYRNVYLHGSTQSSFEKYFQINLDNDCKWVTDVTTPIVRMEADYAIKGQLLVFPINAQGKCNITQYDVVNRHTMICEKYTKKNDTYIRVLNYTMDFNVGRITYDFDNVFPGNDQISKEIVKTLNENSLAIFNEAKGGIEKAFSYVYLQYTNNVFSKLPMREIFLD